MMMDSWLGFPGFVADVAVCCSLPSTRCDPSILDLMLCLDRHLCLTVFPVHPARTTAAKGRLKALQPGILPRPPRVPSNFFPAGRRLFMQGIFHAADRSSDGPSVAGCMAWPQLSD